MIAWSTIISGSTGPIFAIFVPNDRYLFMDDRSGPLFPIPQKTLPWQPIFTFCERDNKNRHSPANISATTVPIFTKRSVTCMWITKLT